MTKAEIVLWASVFVVGISFLKGGNLTAGALVLAWISGQIVYLITGNNLPVEFYLYPDFFVIAVVFCKPERTRADWFVLAIFPVMWALYVADISAFTKWWSLYALVLAQLLAVGWEDLLSYRRGTGSVSHNQPDHPGTLLVAYPAGGRLG